MSKPHDPFDWSVPPRLEIIAPPAPLAPPPENPWRPVELVIWWLSYGIPWLVIGAGEIVGNWAYGGRHYIDLFDLAFICLIMGTFTMLKHPRMVMLPKKYPVDEALTLMAAKFGEKLGREPKTVHVNPYGLGSRTPFAFSWGKDILLSRFLLETCTRDQVEFIVARLCAASRSITPRVYGPLGALGFVLGFIVGGRLMVALFVLLAACVIWCFVAVHRYGRRMHDPDIRALDLTANLDAALDTLPLLPMITRDSNRVNLRLNEKAEALREHWNQRPTFEV